MAFCSRYPNVEFMASDPIGALKLLRIWGGRRRINMNKRRVCPVHGFDLYKGLEFGCRGCLAAKEYHDEENANFYDSMKGFNWSDVYYKGY